MLVGIGYTGFFMAIAGFFGFLSPWMKGSLTSELMNDVFILGMGSPPYAMTFGAIAFVSGLIIMLLAEIVATLRGTEAML